MMVEADVLAAGAQVLQELGFRRAGRLRACGINHRMVLRGLMEVAGVPHELENAALVADGQARQDRAGGVRKRTDRARDPAGSDG
jgi:hypothetical protein